MKTSKTIRHRNIFLYAGPISVLFIGSGLALFFINGSYLKPGMLAWLLASLNFVLALWSLKVAQKKAPMQSMLLVFGGGGLRMLVMISFVLAIVLKQKEWTSPFCLMLLAFFLMYLMIEIVIIYRQGLQQLEKAESLNQLEKEIVIRDF